jgi:hypothetical protein
MFSIPYRTINFMRSRNMNETLSHAFEARPDRVKMLTLGTSDLETPDEQIARLREKREKARAFFELAEGVVVDEELAGINGMAFTLFPDAHHTGADIERAASYLRRNRDVVSLYYVRLEPFAPVSQPAD